MSSVAFWRETIIYAGRVREFNRTDWIVYVAWIGMMFGLFGSVFGFLMVGVSNGVHYPIYVWNVPIGIAIFVVAIGFDTIGHRTIYKQELIKAEALVHHITIFCGVTSVICLCLAYGQRDFFRFPALTLIGLAVFYSMVDEAMHWRRYLMQKSDRVEMWSHLFIFVGHILMSLSWYYWFEMGYPGVKETLEFL
ncbi:MAG: hypothetical protein R3B54_02605 [Bdellovibrionota bacterium]